MNLLYLYIITIIFPSHTTPSSSGETLSTDRATPSEFFGCAVPSPRNHAVPQHPHATARCCCSDAARGRAPPALQPRAGGSDGAWYRPRPTAGGRYPGTGTDRPPTEPHAERPGALLHHL